ncbi:hypothetical protein BDA99DRAFT_509585 [Phascolomyces articulosus]|uniref:Uncharacterized protein n=1 Tax=Phascolomyces articulosus TaxID=60185 RepID=A0AAD5K0B9_9FUNG|nr:hypothetical protein BDA99DRAFT_509585 [Phascolomyces articulosus]
MALDFLSSDIVFPSDSTEPKLSTKSVSKLPGPVDWAFHDYLSTACEKASLPVHTLTDYTQWKKQLHHDDEQQENHHEEFTLDDFKKNTTTLQLSKQEEQIRFLVSNGGKQQRSSSTTANLPTPPNPEATSASNLRAALCGALEHVDNAMQDNHLTRLDKYTPGSYQQNNKEFRWEDEVLFGSFKFAPEYNSARPGLSLHNNNNVDDDDDDDDMDNDLFLPETRSNEGGASPLSATREHFRFLDDHDDFLYEQRSFSTDDEGDFMGGGPTLLDSSRVTSYIASSIDQHQLPPESPLYYPPISSAAAIVPPPPTNTTTTADKVSATPSVPLHRTPIDLSSPMATHTMEGKPTIAKSKVWQGLVGRLKKNLSKPFNNNNNNKPTSSSPSLPLQQSSSTSSSEQRRNELSSPITTSSNNKALPQGRFKRLLFKSRQN